MTDRTLPAISAELIRLANALRAYASEAPITPTNDLLEDPAVALPSHDRARLAQELYRERRLRDRLLNESLFSEPAWDILLDLYAWQQLGRSVSISSACLAAAAPQTTALRYVTRMLADGLLLREIDPDDGRRYWVRLSEGLSALLDGYFDRVAAARAAAAER